MDGLGSGVKPMSPGTSVRNSYLFSDTISDQSVPSHFLSRRNSLPWDLKIELPSVKFGGVMQASPSPAPIADDDDSVFDEKIDVMEEKQQEDKPLLSQATSCTSLSSNARESSGLYWNWNDKARRKQRRLACLTNLARQSVKRSRSSMSFNQFSPEVLMRVFSHLLDVGSKIRLERVNKRFRDCIRNVESWKYNTSLTTKDLMSDEELRSFLSHTKVVTHLELYASGLTSTSVSTLFVFSDKLKVNDFLYWNGVNKNCQKYQLVVACCLGKFANTLKKATIACCGNNNCSIRGAVTASLPLCISLQGVTLAYFNEGNIEGNNTLLLNSLAKMSLGTIALINFRSTIRGAALAAVCNSAKDHSVSRIHLFRLLDDDEPLASMRFELAQFCESLEPAAAGAIRLLNLSYVECGWVELLPTLLAVFPNMTELRLKECPRNATAEDAVKMAQALGAFLHDGAQRMQRVGLNLEIKCREEERAFGGWLWDSIDLIEVRRSGTKRTADMEHWKRTLVHGNVVVNIEVG